MNSYAPVLVLTLCRYEHFRRCIKSLSSCKFADSTDLYIAFDYPFHESQFYGYQQIEEFINDIKGFKRIIVLKRNENYGVLKNFKDATNLIFEQHDRYIVSEDDNFFSPNFLEYINKGLDYFENKMDVFAINGYNYPVKMPDNYKKNIYFWKGLSGWGYGIWRDRWQKFNLDFDPLASIKIVEDFLRDKSNVIELNRYAEHYLPSLLRMVRTKQVRGDTFVNLHIIKNRMQCVFPAISKVRNYGHDGSGMHCGYIGNNIYSQQVIDTREEFEFDEEVDVINYEIYETLRNHFKRTLRSKIKTKLLYWHYILKR